MLHGSYALHHAAFLPLPVVSYTSWALRKWPTQWAGSASIPDVLGCDRQSPFPYPQHAWARTNQWLALYSKDMTMAHRQDAAASTQSYEPRALAKKHRISVEEAQKIIAEHGADRKAADKAARRIAA